MRAHRHGDPHGGRPPLPPNEPGEFCIADGCTKRRAKRNWCNAHYLKLMRRGDANLTVHRQFPSADASWDYYMSGDPPAPGVVWPWNGPKHQLFGYGVIYYANTSALAHRYSYERFVGPIPPGLLLRHNNDIPIDVNPHNLLPGTHADNTRDMHERGRAYRPPARLSTQDAEAIRVARLGGETYQALADRFGVSIGYAWRLCQPSESG